MVFFDSSSDQMRPGAAVAVIPGAELAGPFLASKCVAEHLHVVESVQAQVRLELVGSLIIRLEGDDAVRAARHEQTVLSNVRPDVDERQRAPLMSQDRCRTAEEIKLRWGVGAEVVDVAIDVLIEATLIF